MASAFRRFISRSSLSSVNSAIRCNSAKSPIGNSPTSSPSVPRFSSPSFSSPRRFTTRTPCELGCAQSLLPLHSAVAVARMTSCLSKTSSCRALSQGILCCTSPGL